jgi:hypothetical protein
VEEVGQVVRVTFELPHVSHTAALWLHSAAAGDDTKVNKAV